MNIFTTQWLKMLHCFKNITMPHIKKGKKYRQHFPHNDIAAGKLNRLCCDRHNYYTQEKRVISFILSLWNRKIS